MIEDELSAEEAPHEPGKVLELRGRDPAEPYESCNNGIPDRDRARNGHRQTLHVRAIAAVIIGCRVL